MPTKRAGVEILFGGGWAEDYGQIYSAAPTNGKLVVPFLTTAQNIWYELNGAPHKIGGALKLNAATVTSPVMGIFDYWRSGTTGAPAQKRLCHSGTVCYKEDTDGTWDSLITGLTSGAMPCYTTYNDIVVISSSATADGPRKYDQTSAAVLGGSPPNFAFSCVHKNRVWASGNPAYPSRIYYTDTDDPEDWSGGGSIDVSIDDGNVVTGLYGEHKERLWIFKGGGNPKTATIHYLTGSSPTGADPFTRQPFSKGLDCVNHQSIIPFADDLAFVSSSGIYSLAATDKYGDFEQAALSRPFNAWFKKNLNAARFPYIWGANYETRGLALWTVSRSGQTTHDFILACDYRFDPPRWSTWTVPAAASLAIVKQTTQPELWVGTYTGYVLRMDRFNRDMDGTAYTGRATLPFLNLGSSMYEKTVAKGFLGFVSKGGYPLAFGYKRDKQNQQTVSVNQAGSDILGPTTGNPFTMNTSILGGARVVTQPFDMEGSFRDIQVEVSNGTLNQDMEVHSIGLLYDVGTISEEAA